MRILIVGDPHGDLKAIKKIPVKGADLILIPGDLAKADLARKRFFENAKRKEKGLPSLEEDIPFVKKSHMEMYDSSIKILKYLSSFAPVYTILGNASLLDSDTKVNEKKFGIRLPYLEKAIKKMRNVSLLKDKSVQIKNIKIVGLDYFVDSSWCKEFNIEDKKELQKSKKETARVKAVLKKFGNLEILLCHQPPYGILDKVNFSGAPKSWIGKHAGSKVILDYVKKKKPKYVFCGHIHEARGVGIVGKTIIYNLGCCGGYSILEVN